VDEKPVVTLLEGVFYEDDNGNLTVADEARGAVVVADALKSLVGRKLVLLAHHRPLDPPDRDRWGGGACLYEPAGECPVGHHDRPGWLYTFHHVGTLSCAGSKWAVTTDQGERHEPWLAALVGHRSQIVLSALPDVEDLKAKLNLDEQPNTIEELQARITAMRDLFVEVSEGMKDLKDP
jgi:hypothetical protein